MTPATGEGHDIWTDEFDKVQADELARIDAWRRENLRSAVKRPTPGEPKVYDTVGLALSGGGIRSAAFCLGALQALDGASKIDKLDYLSTVSGGGYIGASCIAGMNQSGGVFPFTTGAGDLSDNHAVGHIRNYSNYLMPRGGLDAIKSVSVLLRGMMTLK